MRPPPLEVQLEPWDSFPDEAGNGPSNGNEDRKQGFLFSGNRNVGGLLELPQGCQGPFQGSRVKVGFLSRRPSGKRPHLALRGESPGFSRVAAAKLFSLQLRWGPHGPAHGVSGNSNLHVSCEGTSGFLCSRCQGLNPHLQLSPET